MRYLALVLSLAFTSLLFACDGPIESDASAGDDPAVVALALSSGDEVVREGTITEVNGEESELTDDLTGKPLSFDARGADLVLEVGDKVVYVLITTPKGKEIVKTVIRSIR